MDIESLLINWAPGILTYAIFRIAHLHGSFGRTETTYEPENEYNLLEEVILAALVVNFWLWGIIFYWGGFEEGLRITGRGARDHWFDFVRWIKLTPSERRLNRERLQTKKFMRELEIEEERFALQQQKVDASEAHLRSIEQPTSQKTTEL